MDKTKYMIFHKRQRRTKYFAIKINDMNIVRVDSFNLLGLHINKNLTWETHTNMIANKISSSTGVINRLKYTLPQRILFTIYNTLITPYFNYCILLWGHKPNRLTSLQKRAIRIISHSNYISHTEPLFKTLFMLKLDDLYRINILKFYHKLINNNLPSNFNSYNETINIPHIPHNIRSQRLRLPIIKHEFAKEHLNYQLPNLLRNTPRFITSKADTHSLYGFNNYIKSYYINNYTMICSTENCYVCRNT
jgi:hypothetical protein